MRSYHVVDVFTARAFGGNQLAVVLEAEGLSTEAMQAIAREFNYSESTFVLPPKDPANTAHVRIFTPAAELPFAGHPNIGTAHVVAQLGTLFGKEITDEVRFEEGAGLVVIDIERDGDAVSRTRLTAPQPPTSRPGPDAAALAECLSLTLADIELSRHTPIIGSVGLPFTIVELTGRDALTRARPDKGAFERHIVEGNGDGVLLYCRTEPGDEVDIRDRMFAPLHGVEEDPATGSANAALVGFLAGLTGEDGTHSWRIAQGVEMGRPSLLHADATREGGVVTRVRIGGQSVLTMRGELVAD
jgi:trans-2,3-dihydro-3-hydroxyanthranilate isomerase